MTSTRFTPVSPTQRRGGRYEELAREHLRRAGLRPLERNYRARGGEIDLICLDGQTLVFIEVRFRRSRRHGLAVETVSPAKQRRLLNTATLYLQCKNLYGRVRCRFDVVGVALDDGKPVFHWIRNAFD